MNVKDKIFSQWTALNHVLFIYKVIGLGLVGLSLVLTVLCFYLSDRTPLVVKDNGDGYTYLMGHRQDVPLQKENIEKFIRQYVGLRYRWDSPDIEKIAANVAPLVTRGFRKKSLLELKALTGDDFKDKKLKQSISDIEVTVTDKSTVAEFDRILRVNGIPLVIPTQISFALVKGTRSYWNRLGLLINGVTIHEGQ